MSMRNIIFKLKCRIFNKTKFFSKVYIKNPANIFVGKNAKILRRCSLVATRGKIFIGDGVHLNRMVTINAENKDGEVILGNGVEINEGSLLVARGKIEVKKNTLIGPGVKIISYQHTFADITKPIKNQDWIIGDILIDEDCWIGANVVIMANVRIGRGVVVGAGAIVNKSLPDYCIAGGCPAKIIRMRCDLPKIIAPQSE
jgi:acetyltransferase-like isoleucine patch superfamily enzyme